MKTLLLPNTPRRSLAIVRHSLAAFAVVAVMAAQDVPAPVEPEVVPPEVTAIETADPTQAAVRIGASFEALAGSEDNAVNLVEGLRAGSEVTLSSEIEGQTVQRTFAPATGEQGYGNVFLSLGLAEQELAKAGVTEPTPAQLEAALNGGVITVGEGEAAKTIELAGVLVMRAEGKGWGQIAREMDVNLGEVVRGIRRNPQVAERLALRPEFAGKPERAERVERVARAERVERVERVARVERPERPAMSERLERPVRVERVERPVRPERPDRPGRP